MVCNSVSEAYLTNRKVKDESGFLSMSHLQLVHGGGRQHRVNRPEEEEKAKVLRLPASLRLTRRQITDQPWNVAGLRIA